MANNSSRYSQIGRALSMAEFKGVVITELKHIKEEVKEINDGCEKRDKRITSLETWKTKMVAIASFVAGCISVGFHVFQMWIKGHK